MPKLTPEGEEIVAGIAQRYGISFDAVKTMLDAVSRGGGTMAQFNVPELGGGGQWMLGGMTMVGDMFNNSLKATVDNLCYELSNLLANQPGVWAPVGQSQQQSQGGAQQQSQGGGQYQGQGALLLAEASNVVAGGVIDLDLAAKIDRKPVASRKIGIAQVVLRTR